MAVSDRPPILTKDHFAVDLDAGTVTCPVAHTVTIRLAASGGGKASFSRTAGTVPLRAQCTPSHRGRTIAIHPHEALLQQARAEQSTPEWAARYRADRPLVERKISHFVRRAWGGRRARTRGLARVSTDIDTRAAAINWARLAVLGLTRCDAGWTLVT